MARNYTTSLWAEWDRLWEVGDIIVSSNSYAELKKVEAEVDFHEANLVLCFLFEAIYSRLRWKISLVDDYIITIELHSALLHKHDAVLRSTECDNYVKRNQRLRSVHKFNSDNMRSHGGASAWVLKFVRGLLILAVRISSDFFRICGFQDATTFHLFSCTCKVVT